MTSSGTTTQVPASKPGPNLAPVTARLATRTTVELERLGTESGLQITAVDAAPAHPY